MRVVSMQKIGTPNIRLAGHSSGVLLSEEVAKINPRWRLYFNRAEMDQILLAPRVFSPIPEDNWSISIAKRRQLRIFTSSQQLRRSPIPGQNPFDRTAPSLSTLTPMQTILIKLISISQQSNGYRMKPIKNLSEDVKRELLGFLPPTSCLHTNNNPEELEIALLAHLRELSYNQPTGRLKDEYKAPLLKFEKRRVVNHSRPKLVDPTTNEQTYPEIIELEELFRGGLQMHGRELPWERFRPALNLLVTNSALPQFDGEEAIPLIDSLKNAIHARKEWKLYTDRKSGKLIERVLAERKIEPKNMERVRELTAYLANPWPLSGDIGWLERELIGAADASEVESLSSRGGRALYMLRDEDAIATARSKFRSREVVRNSNVDIDIYQLFNSLVKELLAFYRDESNIKIL